MVACFVNIFDQEGLPDYWGIETQYVLGVCSTSSVYQEGLPDYWGIETSQFASFCNQADDNQEGLPDYWGIETLAQMTHIYLNVDTLSGRITRLLGY